MHNMLGRHNDTSFEKEYAEWSSPQMLQALVALKYAGKIQGGTSEEWTDGNTFSELLIDYRDVRPFLQTVKYWEEHPVASEQVETYFELRSAVSSERKLAKSMGMTVARLRTWMHKMHLETDFKGKQDGYKQWTAARERLQVVAKEAPDGLPQLTNSNRTVKYADGSATFTSQQAPILVVYHKLLMEGGGG